MARSVAAMCLLVLVVLVAPGCAGPGSEPAPAVESDAAAAVLPEQVETAVSIARELAADPADGEAILNRHGLTEESFDELMYEIAADPELTVAYEAALAE